MSDPLEIAEDSTEVPPATPVTRPPLPEGTWLGFHETDVKCGFPVRRPGRRGIPVIVGYCTTPFGHEGECSC